MARTRVNVEQRVENLLRRGVIAQLAADSVSGVTHRRYWSSDTDATTEDINTSTITYKADPNYPRDGWRSPYRACPVSVIIFTGEGTDPKRATLAAIYSSVREAFDFGDSSAFYDTDLWPVEVQPIAGGESSQTVTDKGVINQVEIQLQVDVNYPGS